MTKTAQNLVAVTPGGDITEDMLVGEYVWYSVPEKMVSIATVRRHVKALGLDLGRFPKARRPEHVAMEACRKVEGVHQNGVRTETRAEVVLRNDKELIYQITKHVADAEQRVVDHPKAVRVIFSFVSETLSFEPLGETEKSEVQNLIDTITEHYENNATKMPGHKVRTILRHYIEAVGGENVRGQAGGVYFMPKVNKQLDGSIIDGREFVGQVVALLTALYPAPDVHRVPCVNDEGQRAYLKRKFIENCSEDLEQYRETLLAMVRTKDERKRGFRRDAVANLVAQRKQIAARKQKFEEILSEELNELDRNLSLADKALSKFLSETDTVIADGE